MNQHTYKIMRGLRKVISLISRKEPFYSLECEMDAEKVSDDIRNLLLNDSPCMIARFGAGELLCMTNYLGVKEKRNNFIRYILGLSQEWWWTGSTVHFMRDLSGFFPVTDEAFERFGALMMEDMKQLDMLGCWDQHESLFEGKLSGVKKVHLRLLEPFWAQKPWIQCLEGRKVLVVHPFADLIMEQYKCRDQIFTQGLLPDMKLKAIPTIMTYGGSDVYSSWFEVLDLMNERIDQEDYDVCLIACGAYGFSMAAHVKRQGKKAIHLGGALQLLFGIRGKRWENPNYGVKEWGIPIGSYSNMMNEYWKRPSDIGKPKSADKIENACYW